VDDFNSSLSKKSMPPVPPKLPVSSDFPRSDSSVPPTPTPTPTPTPIAPQSPVTPKPIVSQPLLPKMPSKISGLGLSQLRTMRKDIETLKKGGPLPGKMSMPPKNLPIGISKEVKKEATKEVLGKMMKEVDKLRQDYKMKERQDTFPGSEKPNLFPHEKESGKKVDDQPLFPKPAPSEPRPSIESLQPIVPAKINSTPAPAPIAPASGDLTLETPAPKSKKGLWIVSIIVVVLAMAGGFIYWWKFMRQPATHLECGNFQCVQVDGEGENKCQIDNDCLPPEPEMPVSLLPGIETETIEVLAGRESDFRDNLIRTVGEQTLPEGIKRILIKKVADNKEKKYASLSEMISLMEINIPLSLRSNLEEDYTLFVYTPGTEERTVCQAVSRADVNCYGPRLGLAVKLSETNKQAVVQELVKWETTITQDLENLILADIADGEMAKFQYSALEDLKGASFIRYINLPISSITLDYGIKDNLLIIGTSKNTLLEVLDLIPNE